MIQVTVTPVGQGGWADKSLNDGAAGFMVIQLAEYFSACHPERLLNDEALQELAKWKLDRPGGCWTVFLPLPSRKRD